MPPKNNMASIKATRTFDKSDFLRSCLDNSDITVDFQKIGQHLNIAEATASTRFRLMMASNKIDSEENLAYLKTCLYLSHQKLDFHAIAAANGGIRKTAAEKRYSRLMTSIAILPAVNTNGGNGGVASKKRARAVTPVDTSHNTTNSPKRRKVTTSAPELLNDGDWLSLSEAEAMFRSD